MSSKSFQNKLIYLDCIEAKNKNEQFKTWFKKFTFHFNVNNAFKNIINGTLYSPFFLIVDFTKLTAKSTKKKYYAR